MWNGQGKGSGDSHVGGTTGDFRTQEHLRAIWLEAVRLGKDKREKRVKERGIFEWEFSCRFSKILSRDSLLSNTTSWRMALLDHSHLSWTAQAHRLRLSLDFKSRFWKTKWQMLLQKYRAEQEKAKTWPAGHTPAAESLFSLITLSVTGAKDLMTDLVILPSSHSFLPTTHSINMFNAT